MQKVISSLEQLEKLATLGDAERETIENLNTTISHLELEDTKKIEERQRNSKVQCNLDLVTLLVSATTVTKLHNVTKSDDFMFY